MELFDILDKNGKPTGFTATRGTQLQDGQFYLGVHIYIYNATLEFLLQQRSYDKTFLPGGWDVVLEHVIAGETSKEAAVRGIAEEIGLYVQGDIIFAVRMVWEHYPHIVDVYIAKTNAAISELCLGHSEVIGAKFVSKAEMLAHISGMSYRPKEYRQFITNEILKL
ncbi:MAG: NUDIX domain-containing protein [Defluviitaleaceae bacterium]|nr:NUDIX domain-containing protein [Defluviitaleaceae bacterium]